MLRIIIADAALELVPEALAGHPSVRKAAKAAGKKPSRMLFDINRFTGLMQKLPDGARRGRPDIVHYILLNVLETPLCREGLLDVQVHTRDGHLIRIRPDTRLPRGEDRFQGLMAKVLAEGRSQTNDPLVWVEGVRTAQQVVSQAPGPVFRLDEGGRVLGPSDVPGLADAEDLCLVIGGFQNGEFSPAWQQAAPEAISLWPEPLNAWTVASECVSACRTRWRPSPHAPTTPPP